MSDTVRTSRQRSCKRPIKSEPDSCDDESPVPDKKQKLSPISSKSIKTEKHPSTNIPKKRGRPKINKIVSLKEPKVMLEKIKISKKSSARPSSKGKPLRKPPPKLDKISDRNQFDDLFNDHESKSNLNVCYDDQVAKKKVPKQHKSFVRKVGPDRSENEIHTQGIKKERNVYSREIKNASIFQEIIQELNQENTAEKR